MVAPRFDLSLTCLPQIFGHFSAFFDPCDKGSKKEKPRNSLEFQGFSW